MNAELLQAAKALPLSERVEFAEAVWESIADDGYKPLPTAAQAAELERRLAEHRRDPNSAIPWSEVKADLENRYGGPK